LQKKKKKEGGGKEGGQKEGYRWIMIDYTLKKDTVIL
jgi:hypothetical protein